MWKEGRGIGDGKGEGGIGAEGRERYWDVGVRYWEMGVVCEVLGKVREVLVWKEWRGV